jgi:hypothetical protein
MKTTINRIEWELIRVQSEDCRLALDNGKMCFGTTRYYEKTIAVDRDLERDQCLQTTRHELAHAFLSATQLLEKREGFTEEELCEFVAKYGGQIEETAQKFVGEEFKNG